MNPPRHEPNARAGADAIEHAKRYPAVWIERWFFVEVDEGAQPATPKTLTPLCYSVAGARRALEEAGENEDQAALVSFLTTFDPTDPEHMESFWLHYRAKEAEERECLS